ncbi:MAG: hypothetical protein DRR19_31790 [Candidatus Parabeggiatoa sp. nov. 1]|nr:MAG: hypothetical protein DRR19_31790 [Gammaproteobacteria bacterium]
MLWFTDNKYNALKDLTDFFLITNYNPFRPKILTLPFSVDNLCTGPKSVQAVMLSLFLAIVSLQQ